MIEFDRPTRKSKDGAKSDALDAVRGSREMLGRKRLSVPRAHDGVREAIRVHAVTRAAAVRARTGAINELKAMIVTSDEALRAELPTAYLRPGHDMRASFATAPHSPVHQRATRTVMRSLARRIQLLDDEIGAHDRALRELLDQAAPQLIAERGIGYITAAAFSTSPGHMPAAATAKPPSLDSAAPHRSPPPPGRTRPAIA